MNFGELLGAGLLGGVGNAAKGAGDRLREEAKQKREMALQAQKQADAMAVQTTSDDAAMARLKAQGLVTIGVNKAASVDAIGEQDNAGLIASDLVAQRGDIASAAAVVEQANNITNLDKKGDIAKDLAKLQSELNKGENADKATLDQLRVKLEGSIAANAASQLATTNAAAVAQKVTTDAAAVAQKVTTDANAAATATDVAKDTAKTLAGYEKETQAAAAAFAANTAEVKQGYDMATLSKTGKQQLLLLNREYDLKVKAAIDAKVGDIETFYDETTGRNQKWEKTASGWEKRGGNQAPDATTSKGLTLQVAYNDQGEEIKGYMNGTDFVQVGGAKAVKAKSEEEARTYFTGQAKFILGGSPNAFIKAKLTDADANLMSEWISEAEASFAANPNTSLSQIVKNIMFKPWVLDDLDITDADISAGEDAADTAGATAGATVLQPIEYARQIAQKRQPDFIKAQQKYDAFLANNKDPAPVIAMMKKMGYDPDLLTK